MREGYQNNPETKLATNGIGDHKLNNIRYAANTELIAYKEKKTTKFPKEDSYWKCFNREWKVRH